MPAPVLNGQQNGHVNGNTKNHTEGPPIMIPKSSYGSSSAAQDTLSVMKRTGKSTTRPATQVISSAKSHTQQITVLQQTISSTRIQLISDISDVNDHYVESMTLEAFVHYIESERLTHMPRRGSRWDKVLKWAEFFALQVFGYATALETFVPESNIAAKLICASCRVLIELGPGNSQAIETAFAVFYKIGLSLSFFYRHHELLSSTSKIRTEVGHAYSDLLILVRDVSLYYRTRISAIQSMEVSLDFNSIFGRNLEAFYDRKTHIIDDMWKFRLGDDSAIDIQVIRKWLSIQDIITKNMVQDQLTINGQRDEYTCEWFQRRLLDFSRSNDDVLQVTGQSGCGKSFLYGWTVERLQRPIGRKKHETLSLTINTEIPSHCTSLAIAKNLALQLLENNIGNVALLNELEKVYNTHLGVSDCVKVGEHLWRAIETGIKSQGAENLMIVIDGLDNRIGEQTATKITKDIARLTSQNPRVQAIILARLSTELECKSQTFAITADHTHEDLRHMTEHALRKYQHFRELKEHKQEALAEKIAHAAKGNFLWMLLGVNQLSLEASRDGFLEAAKSLGESSKTLEDTITDFAKSTTAKYTEEHCVSILSWLLIAERPLTLLELKELLQDSIPKKNKNNWNVDAREIVNKSCGLLLVVRHGVVRFRHGAFREYLGKLQAGGVEPFSTVEAAHADFTTKLLAHFKHHFTVPCEPAFKLLDAGSFKSVFAQDALLEYGVRNWILHFRKSSLYKISGPLKLPESFKSSFPASVQLAMVEWYCWELQDSLSEVAKLHDLALRIRKEIFTEKHQCVIQALIICGTTYKSLSKLAEAGEYFYHASRLCQSILKAHHSVTISCTTSFLETTETTTITTRTESVTHREEMIQYAIVACKHHYGKTSDIVIRYYRSLAELYVAIHEEQKAETVWRELQEIIVIRHGKGSVEETEISGLITVVLKKTHKHDEVVEYERSIFETTTTLAVWDIEHIRLHLKLAIAYEERHEFLKAEERYVILWRQLIEHCHQVHIHNLGMDIHISMIDVALEYVRFLRRCHRHEEAAGILICIWSEYQEYDFESEIIFLRLKVVGEIMCEISLLSVAILVFQKCLTWFKSHSKHEHVTSCQILISHTMEEIIQTTTTTTTKQITEVSSTTTSTEIIIKEVFRSTMSKTTVTTETISVCRSMVSYYMELEQWSEAIEVTRQSLELIWRTIVRAGGTIALPREFSLEAIEIAIELATCHVKLQHFHEAEQLYLRIYRACFNSCGLHDERFTKAYTALIKLYEDHRRWHKVIEIYKEILIASRKSLGASHALTIKILYALGGLCLEHGHGHSHEYYQEIVTVINRGSKICHHDALVAMKFLCSIYYEEARWEELKITCEILWETWVHHHHEHKIDSEFVQFLYMRYIYVLEHHSSVDFEIIRILTIRYHEVCSQVFGIHAVITVQALLELAQICIRSEKYVHEAISYYEKVIESVTTSTSSTVISTTTITKTKEKLTKAYIHICTHGTVSTTTIARAVVVLTERFQYLKLTMGCSHTETLTILRELVLLHWRQKSTEATAVVLKMLLETIIEIITKEQHSRKLYDAANAVAGIYLSCELREEARLLLRELHKHILYKGHTSAEKSGFKLDKLIGKSSYVFLVIFEARLQGSVTVSYSQVMANLLSEAVLYESYTHCLKSEKNVEVILVSGARLYMFLLKTSRKELVTFIQEELYKIFMKKWGASSRSPTEITLLFFVSLLKELGHEHHHARIGNAACVASTISVRELQLSGKFQEAYELGLCAFQFIDQQRAYHHFKNVAYGFKLSSYLAGRGLNKSTEKSINADLRAKSLQLSREIITQVLSACRESKIDFVRLQLGDLNDLVGLLGGQQNYADLEWLLNSLWYSRELQKKWSPEIIVGIGRRFVQASFLGNHSSEAIKLCEAICYNLRRVWGSLDPNSLDISDLLSHIYTAAGHHREAMRVHEEILRLVVDGDDDDDQTIDTVAPEVARRHLDLLKASYQRLGGWDKKASVYQELVDQLLQMPEYKSSPAFKGASPIAKWKLNEKTPPKGEFTHPVSWEFVDPENLTESGELLKPLAPKDPRRGLRRVTSNWGMAH
ncbi:hypothetical protein G7Y89_g7843 [Cudoniella acicularis]|uniref:Nephrocystin 3-like N-terminal domain-containing protein n=1 Tax=Cudoniella acicularis TaxID=354080 RepID=A0A8H4W158_9HELO|nr:hypothetical protein G7Y89_g7843 [Cudoniella acicularis]